MVFMYRISTKMDYVYFMAHPSRWDIRQDGTSVRMGQKVYIPILLRAKFSNCESRVHNVLGLAGDASCLGGHVDRGRLELRGKQDPLLEADRRRVGGERREDDVPLTVRGTQALRRRCHARQSPRGRGDARGHGTDRAPDHKGN
jgi:hypothetical protein